MNIPYNHHEVTYGTKRVFATECQHGSKLLLPSRLPPQRGRLSKGFSLLETGNGSSCSTIGSGRHRHPVVRARRNRKQKVLRTHHDKNEPILWELDREAFKTAKLKQAHLGLVKTGSFALRTTTKSIKEGLKVIPLNPEDLKVLVKENQTEDLSMLAKQKDSRSELASMWFKAACVAKPDEATKSQVAVTVVQLEEEAVPQDVLEQLQAALLDIRSVQPEAGARLTALLSPLLPAVTAEEQADEETVETVANPLTKRS